MHSVDVEVSFSGGSSELTKAVTVLSGTITVLLDVVFFFMIQTYVYPQIHLCHMPQR